MADVVAVRIPQENVNDEVVTVMLWHVRDGETVEAGQPLAEVETSKAAFDVPSPSRGVVRIVVSAEQEVPVGDVLCYVGETPAAIDTWLQLGQTWAPAEIDTAAALPIAGAAAVASRIDQAITFVAGGLDESAAATGPGASQETGRQTVTPAAEASPPTTRFSRAALDFLRRERIDESTLAGRGLVRLRDVQAIAPVRPASPATLPIAGSTNEPAVIRGAAGVPTRVEKLSRAKRLEAKRLEWSSRQALRSAVVATVTTTGRRPVRKHREDASEFLAAALIHESARLLKKFPALNAFCSGDEIHFYENVHVGYALDAGHGLKVPVFRDAERKSLDELVEQRRTFVADYLSDKLRPDALSGGTFSITDLSGSGVFLFEPLIVEAQAAILGVGGNFLPPDSPAIAYNLVLAFDHRLVEGRTAARFVNELKERMLIHEEGEAAADDSAAVTLEPRCAECGTTFSQARQRKHFLVQVADEVPGQTRLVCTICLQGR